MATNQRCPTTVGLGTAPARAGPGGSKEPRATSHITQQKKRRAPRRPAPKSPAGATPAQGPAGADAPGPSRKGNRRCRGGPATAHSQGSAELRVGRSFRVWMMRMESLFQKQAEEIALLRCEVRRLRLGDKSGAPSGVVGETAPALSPGPKPSDSQIDADSCLSGNSNGQARTFAAVVKDQPSAPSPRSLSPSQVGGKLSSAGSSVKGASISASTLSLNTVPFRKVKGDKLYANGVRKNATVDPPPYAGKSLQAAALKGQVVTNSRPPFCATETILVKRPISTSTKSKVCSESADEIKCDATLYYYLIDKFAYMPRDNRIMGLMHNALTRYLTDYDCSNYSIGQIYRLKIDAVRAALFPPREEQETRVLLRDYDPKVLEKHAQWTGEGILGRNSWWQSSERRMPKVKK
uniref:Uncharacterized protein n=1 Tax=Korle-bu Aedes virus TaxID=2605631 RepID=A0A679DYK8_9VIRU|nr:hypothetical protein 1 [Korle-bu Aedes virus]